jgi:hypothetical protein
VTGTQVLQQTAFFTDVNGDLYLQHYNGSVMENVLKIGITNNMYAQKSLVMGGNKVYTAGFLGLQAGTTVTAVTNSFFLDNADNVLKFKDNSRTVKVVNLT